MALAAHQNATAASVDALRSQPVIATRTAVIPVTTAAAAEATAPTMGLFKHHLNNHQSSFRMTERRSIKFLVSYVWYLKEESTPCIIVWRLLE